MAELEPPRSLIKDIELAAGKLGRSKELPQDLESTATNLYSRALNLSDRFSGEWHLQKFTSMYIRVSSYEKQVREAVSPEIVIEGRKFVARILETGQKKGSTTPTPHEVNIGGYIDGDSEKEHYFYTIKEAGTNKNGELLVEKEEYEDVNNVLGFIEQLFKNK